MDRFTAVYKGVQWVNSMFDKTERRQFLLDPLTTVVKLAMLKYKTPQTKIRIANYKISYSDPTPFQGVSRWMMGDSRSNYNYLYPPLLYFCHLKYNSENSPLPSELFDFYNSLVIDGLETLKATYLHGKNDLVLECLDLYLTLLKTEGESSIQDRYKKAINSVGKNTYDEFLKCWNKSNIEVLTNMFKELEMKSEDTAFVNKTLESMENYLEAINSTIDKLRDH